MKGSSFKIIQKFLSDFLAENLLLRRIRGFFNHKVFPLLFKAVAALLAFILIALILIKIFNPTYLDKIYQKSSFYFFHYLNLDNQEFSDLNISGNNRAKIEDIENIVNDVVHNFTKNQLHKNSGETYEPLIQQIMVEIKERSPWVNNIVITRSMPRTINIVIDEYEPFAIWEDGGKKYVTDKEGNVVLVNDIEEFKHLVILSGKGANTHAKSLFNIFAIDPALSRRVYSATWLGGRRWDIRFDNGLLIKLPEDNISDAWDSLIKIYNMPGSIVGLDIIDLRIEGKIYLQYRDSIMKELKSL